MPYSTLSVFPYIVLIPNCIHILIKGIIYRKDVIVVIIVLDHSCKMNMAAVRQIVQYCDYENRHGPSTRNIERFNDLVSLLFDNHYDEDTWREVISILFPSPSREITYHEVILNSDLLCSTQRCVRILSSITDHNHIDPWLDLMDTLCIPLPVDELLLNPVYLLSSVKYYQYKLSPVCTIFPHVQHNIYNDMSIHVSRD